MGYPKYFREVTDCSMCPFFTDYEMYAFRCNGAPNYSCPCMNMEEYGNMTIKEVSRAVIMKVQNSLRDDMEYQEIEEEIRLKKEEKRKRALETKALNYGINIEIKAVRSRIKKRKTAIRNLRLIMNYSNLSNILNTDMEDGIIQGDNQMIIDLLNENEKDMRELDRLMGERSRRNKERKK